MKLVSYFSWHYLYAPGQILKTGKNLLIFFTHYFSAKLLLKTLLSPWKRMVVKKRPGFSFQNFFDVLSFNLISRSVGLIIRTTFLAVWFTIELLTLFFGLVFLLVWIIIPGLTLPLFLVFKEKPDPFKTLLKKGIKTQEVIQGLSAKNCIIR